MIVFLIVVLVFYSLVHSYVITRGWMFLHENLPWMNKKVYLAFMISVSLSYILYMAFFRNGKTFFAKVFMYIGNYWLVILFYSFLFFVLVDLIYGTLYLIKPLHAMILGQKNFLYQILGKVILVFLLLVITIGTYLARSTKTITYPISIQKSGNGMDKLRIAMISDLHLGGMIGRNRIKSLVEMIHATNPDLVLFVGDLIDGDIEPVIREDMLAEIKTLNPRYGVYGVTGNHEYYGARTSGGVLGGSFEKAMAYFEESGIRMLLDESAWIADRFYLVGRVDVQSKQFTGRDRKTLDEILKDVVKEKPIFLMDHQPLERKEAQDHFVDIKLSGHTHRGQLWPNTYITRRIYGQDYGLLKLRHTHHVISSGVGTWGPPVRIGSRSEIVLLNVEFEP
jgi:uncharacterized protein